MWGNHTIPTAVTLILLAIPFLGVTAEAQHPSAYQQRSKVNDDYLLDQATPAKNRDITQIPAMYATALAAGCSDKPPTVQAAPSANPVLARVSLLKKTQQRQEFPGYADGSSPRRKSTLDGQGDTSTDTPPNAPPPSIPDASCDTGDDAEADGSAQATRERLKQLNKLADRHLYDKNLPEAIKTLTSSVTIAEQSFGPNSPITAHQYQCLAHWLREIKDPDAPKYYRLANATWQHPPDTLKQIEKLLANKEYEKAIEHIGKLQKDMQGFPHNPLDARLDFLRSQVRSSQGNLPQAFIHLQNAINTNNQYMEAVWPRKQHNYPDLFGPDAKEPDYRTVLIQTLEYKTAYVDIALKFHTANPATRMDDAQRIAAEAVQLAKLLYNPPDTSPWLDTLAEVQLRNGNYDDGRETFAVSLRLRDSHKIPDGLKAAENMVRVADKMKSSEALESVTKRLELYERAWPTLNREYGMDNPKLLPVAHEMAKLYALQVPAFRLPLEPIVKEADYPKALLMLLRRLYILEAQGDLEGTAGALKELGDVSLKALLPNRAEKYFKQLLDLRIRGANGKETLDVLDALDGLSRVYAQMGDKVRELEYKERSLAVLKRSPKTDATVAAMLPRMERIAWQQEQLKNLDAAIRTSEEILKLEKEKGDQDSILRALTNLHLLYGKKKDWRRVIDLRQEQLRILEADPDQKSRLAYSYGGIAMFYEYAGDLKNSEKYLQKELGLLSELSGGPDNREVASALYHYANFLQRHGRLADAEKTLRRMVSAHESFLEDPGRMRWAYEKLLENLEQQNKGTSEEAAGLRKRIAELQKKEKASTTGAGGKTDAQKSQQPQRPLHHRPRQAN